MAFKMKILFRFILFIFVILSNRVNAQHEIRFDAKQFHSDYLRVLEKGIGGYWVALELQFLNLSVKDTVCFCIDEESISPSSILAHISGNPRKGFLRGRGSPFNYLKPIELEPGQSFVDTVYIPFNLPLTSRVEVDLEYTIEWFSRQDLVSVRDDVSLESCLSKTKMMRTKLVVE
jgi:hypothetical protein